VPEAAHAAPCWSQGQASSTASGPGDKATNAIGPAQHHVTDKPLGPISPGLASNQFRPNAAARRHGRKRKLGLCGHPCVPHRRNGAQETWIGDHPPWGAERSASIRRCQLAGIELARGGAPGPVAASLERAGAHFERAPGVPIETQPSPRFGLDGFAGPRCALRGVSRSSEGASNHSPPLSLGLQQLKQGRAQIGEVKDRRWGKGAKRPRSVALPQTIAALELLLSAS